MRMVMVTVRDVKSEVYMRPWFAQTAGAAIRAFSDEVLRDASDNTLSRHPEDYALYEIGLFDDNEGKVYPYDVPKLLIHADQVANSNHAVHKNITAV